MTGAIATAAPGRFRTTLAVRQPVRAIVDLRIRGNSAIGVNNIWTTS
jgi:hypothetical protein